MRHADLRAFDLAVAGLAAQVPDDFADVGDAGRAERVALREEAAAGVHGDLAADVRRALVDHAAGFAFAADAEVLVVQQLGGGEAVVELDQVEVLGPDAGLLVRDLRGVAGERVDVGMVRSRSVYGSLVSTEAATLIGCVVYWRALSIEQRIAAAAPSPVGQHMRSVFG